MNLYVALLEVLSSAVKSLSTSKLRSLLTILGVVIGITSVTVISSVGNGLQNEMIASLEGQGLERLEIQANTSKDASLMLDESDAEVLLVHENVNVAIPYIFYYASTNERITEELIGLYVNATSEDYSKALTKDIVYGRFLTEGDIDSAMNVIVIPERLSERVLGYKNSIGETITISFQGDFVDFVVVGITESDANDIMFSGMPEVFVPYTFMQEYMNINSVDGLYVGVKDTKYTGDIAEELKKILQLKNGTDEDSYYVYNLMEQLEEIKNVFSQVVLFVNIVASISLFVGSIGIMNIMLVTVTERTREIGIRKALGATKGNIRLQFLIEAIILSLVGGILGTTIGYLLAIVVGNAINIVPAFNLLSIITSLFICCIIGVLSGVYPASKASNLNPITALRYE